MKNSIQAVIFDFDGTLVDSEPNYYEADRRLLEKYGIRFTVAMKSEFVGTGNEFMLRVLKERYQLMPSVGELLDEKNKIYLEIALNSTHVYPEMLRFLQLIKAASLPVAIASGSSLGVLQALLKATKLQEYFPIVVSSEEVARSKPAPDVFLEAAKRLGVKPENILVIEDSHHGVAAAKAAGMQAMAIPGAGEDLANFSRADTLFSEGITSFNAGIAFKAFQQRP